MNSRRYVYLDDPASLRKSLARAERDQTLRGQVWGSVRRRAQAAPVDFPWFTPFVALMTGQVGAVAAAKQSIRDYLATLDTICYDSCLHFHFWCNAFPHARWALYFDWLRQFGVWDAAEETRCRERFIEFAYVNFFYGLRMKPEPECVDNQALSVALCCALIGELFPDSTIAARMREDGMRRLPAMLGGFRDSGYSGEGSTYMDHVVGPAIPFIVELLERVHGGDWFSRPLPPRGGSAAAICRMITRQWAPSGLLLPWDHYGFLLGMRSCLAYAARRSAEPEPVALLQQANWAHDASIGWGFDDLVWSLIWWPEHQTTGPAFSSWAEPAVGGALVSPDSQLHLVQIWDETGVKFPVRAHVNPNAILLTAYGSPLTVDGMPAKGCKSFEYDDTWFVQSNMSLKQSRLNFGVGCAGAHNVLLVDGCESMHVTTHYQQAQFVPGESLTADVTPMYAEHWIDTRCVRRRSRLCADRFWLIEDLACFSREHTVTARWYLRPGQLPAEHGVLIETAEGVRLHLLPLFGPDQQSSQLIDGFPDRLDGRSVRVDFQQRGRDCRWLWLAWPEQTRREVLDVSTGWETAAGTVLDFTRPAYMLADLPLAKQWTYRRTFARPAAGPLWLRLPQGLRQPQVWINGTAVPVPNSSLLAPQIALPAADEFAVVVQTDVGQAQYVDSGGFWGRPAVLAATTEPVTTATYANGIVTIQSGQQTWHIDHVLMEVP